MTKRLLLTGLFLLVTLMLSLSAQPRVGIRFHEQQVYFPDSEIQIHISLQNESAETYRFRLADDRIFSIDIEARDRNNRPVTPAENATIGRQSNQQVYYRTVSLQPGEEFAFVELLNDYVNIQEPGVYTVRATFFPQLTGSSERYSSNSLTLHVRPGYSESTRQEQVFRDVVETELARQRLSPDQIVEFMLDARQQENWERFFLYLNLEKLYRQDAGQDRRFRRLSEMEQIQELERFRAQLEGRGIESDLVAAPSGFEVVRTTYTPTEGEVVARLLFDFDSYREIKQYTYEFELRNGFWEIIGYRVVNLGNEALPE